MTRIGLISDTHGFLDLRLIDLLADVDEIWHAGDIGSLDVLSRLQAFKPTRAVWGNADSHDIQVTVDPPASSSMPMARPMPTPKTPDKASSNFPSRT